MQRQNITFLNVKVPVFSNYKLLKKTINATSRSAVEQILSKNKMTLASICTRHK